MRGLFYANPTNFIFLFTRGIVELNGSCIHALIRNKAETAVAGSFEEYGHMPEPQNEKAPEMSALLEDIAAGKATTQIIRENPRLAFRVNDIDTLRQTFLSEKYAEQNRAVEVQYIYGATGTGKTRGIYQRHGAHDIYRVTNYQNGKGVSFDDYHGQDVIAFEESTSQPNRGNAQFAGCLSSHTTRAVQRQGRVLYQGVHHVQPAAEPAI